MTPSSLPPLPLIPTTPELKEKYACNHAFLIDNSTLEHWQLCSRLYELAHLRKRQLAISRAGRNFGSTVHQALAHRYRTIGAGTVGLADTALMNSAAFEWLQTNPQPPGDFRDYNHACKVIAVYNKVYPFEPFTILPNSKGESFVEASFALPLGVVYNGAPDYVDPPDAQDLVIYCGRIDMAITNPDGEWTFDHKTAYMFGEQWKDDLQQNGGQMGYCWAFQQVFGRKPRGFIINGIRVRKPSRKAEYEQVAPVDNTDFVRIPFEVSEDNIDEWREDVLALVAQLFAQHATGVMPRCRKACVTKYGRCDMYDICSLPRLSRETVLTSTLFEDNNWTPLNRPGE